MLHMRPTTAILLLTFSLTGLSSRSDQDNKREVGDPAKPLKAISDAVVLSSSSDANSREHARKVIEDAWTNAAPVLLLNVTNNNPQIAEFAIKSLILMRNEDIVKSLVRMAKETTNEYSRTMLLFTLSMMCEQRKSIMPGRKCMGESESKELYDQLIAPVLREEKWEEKVKSHNSSQKQPK